MLTKDLNSAFKGFGLTLVAVVAFAANSILCRKALGEQLIDPASFTVIRVLSGTVTLMLILIVSQLVKGEFRLISKQLRAHSWSLKSWLASLCLLFYAICFSYAYVSLNTAAGALILLATVQIGLLIAHLIAGNRLNIIEWIGVLVTVTGFVYLMLPKAQAPSLIGSVLMVGAGVAWVYYTIAGKKAHDAFQMITISFVRCAPFSVLLLVFSFNYIEIEGSGALLAVLSGSVASALGYVIWYQALRHISLTVAALSQLGAPVLAAMGGVYLVGEPMTSALWIATSAIVFGIALVVIGQTKHRIYEG
jgi:drug/metabolite transporter (DMT)-like permease